MPLKASDLLKLQDLHPDLVKLVSVVASRHSIGIAQTVRSVAESAANIAAGKSWLKNPANSKHIRKSDGFAHAFDFFIRNPNGSADWLSDYGPIVRDFEAEAKAQGVKIRPGYYWKQRDAGHIELL